MSRKKKAAKKSAKKISKNEKPLKLNMSFEEAVALSIQTKIKKNK